MWVRVGLTSVRSAQRIVRGENVMTDDNDRDVQGEGTENEAREDATGAVDQRGFASMDGQKQRQIASKGGKAAHEKGTAHEFTPDEARAAGRKGGGGASR